MNCLKCGKNTEETAVFCPDCLAKMERYPVKPGTPVYLPHRAAPQEVKKTQKRRREITPELVMANQRKLIKWIILVLGVLLVILLVMGWLLLEQVAATPMPIGRNYTSLG